MSKETEHLKRLIFKQSQEITELRNENIRLKEQVAGKPMTDREQLLLRVAKQIVKELET